MQIREQGRQVQLIRSTYDKDLKRNVAKVIGHIARYSDEKPSADLLAILRPEEVEQLNAWYDEMQSKRTEADKYSSAVMAVGMLDRIIAGVPLMTDQVAEDVWSRISALQKSLKKAGHKRPVKVTPDEKDVRQTSIV